MRENREQQGNADLLPNAPIERRNPHSWFDDGRGNAGGGNVHGHGDHDNVRDDTDNRYYRGCLASLRSQL
jgi:hypothetical protein